MVPCRVYVGFFYKIFIFILVIIFCTGKFSIRASLVEGKIEIDSICPLSVNPLRTLMDRNIGL